MSRETSVRYALFAVLAVVGLAFLPVLWGEFVHDDLTLIEQQPKFHSLGFFWEQISEPFWSPELAYWRPVTSVLLSLGYVLGGGGPVVLHAFALAAHLAAVAMAFALVRRLTGRNEKALFAALLFGLHPVHVEGVAWIAAINDPLWGLAALTAMNALLRWRDAGSARFPWGVIGALVFGLLCKETGLMIVPMVVWLDWVARGRSTPAPVGATRRLYAAMVVVVALYFVARMPVFGELSAGFGRGWTDPAYAAGRVFTFRVEMLGTFVELLVAPFDVTPFRQVTPELPMASGVFLRAALWSVAYLGLSLVALRLGWRAVLFGCGLIALTVAPPIARFKNVGAYPIVDRYLYIAVFGWVLALVWLALERWPRARVARFALLGLAAWFASATWLQTRVWRSQETLVAHSVARNPDDPILQFMLGEVLLRKFEASGDPSALTAARMAFEQADAAPPLFNAGQQMVRNHRSQTRLGLAWCAMFEEDRKPRPDYADVIARFEQVVAEHRDPVRALIGLGVACAKAGEFPRAERSLRRAIESDPRSSEAHHNLAFFLATLRRVDEARPHLDEALRLNPNNRAARELREKLE